SLSKAVQDDSVPNVPEPAANGPRLGAVANVTPVLERPAPGARELGYLHAGARVARAQEPYSRRGCGGGWYPVRPRGFVCATESATVDMAHPTLAAMALTPHLDQPLPYAYARTRAETPLFERDPAHDDAVLEAGKLKRRAGMAVVGSWSARDPAGKVERLALLTNGRFVRASDLQAADASEFKGVEISKREDLPLAFVVKRGVHSFKLDGEQSEKADALSYHDVLHLSGRFHSVGDVKYWAVATEHDAGHALWLRHRDVVVVQERNAFPDFAQGTQRWMDLSVVTGIFTLYEGKRPIFVTLASVNRDAHTSDADKWLGTFEVTGKEVTLATRDPNSFNENFEVFDAPWGLTLSSGMLVYGAYWHDRFGVDHGPGAIELSPADAERVYQWALPQIPEGWHGLVAPLESAEKTRIVIRK
ncbi:MAG TPA: L,D-transpeptidase, partial [Polyangiaceae bacterium]|nr:L,D-transpeptidase [Polyangiaceae bacterium]